MVQRTFLNAGILVGIAVGSSGAAVAGTLPGFKQIGCWNKVVAVCEAKDAVEERAHCQHQGFATCNRAHSTNSDVSLDQIRRALPSFTAERIIIRQSSDTLSSPAVQ